MGVREPRQSISLCNEGVFKISITLHAILSFNAVFRGQQALTMRVDCPSDFVNSHRSRRKLESADVWASVCLLGAGLLGSLLHVCRYALPP